MAVKSRLSSESTIVVGVYESPKKDRPLRLCRACWASTRFPVVAGTNVSIKRPDTVPVPPTAPSASTLATARIR